MQSCPPRGKRSLGECFFLMVVLGGAPSKNVFKWSWRWLVSAEVYCVPSEVDWASKGKVAIVIGMEDAEELVSSVFVSANDEDIGRCPDLRPCPGAARVLLCSPKALRHHQAS